MNCPVLIKSSDRASCPTGRPRQCRFNVGSISTTSYPVKSNINPRSTVNMTMNSQTHTTHFLKTQLQCPVPGDSQILWSTHSFSPVWEKAGKCIKTQYRQAPFVNPARRQLASLAVCTERSSTVRAVPSLSTTGAKRRSSPLTQFGSN